MPEMLKTLQQPQNSDIEKRPILSYVLTIVITFGLTMLFLNFVMRPVCVFGSSMQPTYHDGQVLLIEEISHSYNQFDVVTIKTENKPLIKRVIGCPHDTVQIIDGAVYVNDELLDDVVDVYIENPGNASTPITLDENEYFVLGDNRNNSCDSRFDSVGVIHADNIFGKVIFTLVP